MRILSLGIKNKLSTTNGAQPAASLCDRREWSHLLGMRLKIRHQTCLSHTIDSTMTLPYGI